MTSVAVVGAGISGLTAAKYLQSKHNVTVFEARDKLGGHTDTHSIEIDGEELQVDTGFIVFNDRTYPNFIRMIESLGVSSTATEMSFSVSSPGFEYNGHNLNTLFSQRRNLFRPGFLRMVRDILRFNKEARTLSEEDESLDTGTYLARNNYSEQFSNNYLLPMAAAIWSTGSEPVRAFPISALVRFFNHHGLMDLKNRPQWRVINDGSRSYVNAIESELQDVRLSQSVTGITRQQDHVSITTAAGTEDFDFIVIASHSDQALRMLNDASNDEERILGQMKYTSNRVTLHTDASIMPTRSLSWASWNYHLDRSNDSAALTYYMNRLQHLTVKTPVLVTLNDPGMIDDSKVLGSFEYDHPFYNHEMLDAQSQWETISGHNRTHYAGAYWSNGFHEDGVVSALKVCEQLGVEPC